MIRLLPAIIAGALAAVCLTAGDGPTGNVAAAGGEQSRGKRKESEAVTRAIAYGESVIGAPYVWWKGGPLPKKAPMWTKNGPPPDADVVRKEGTNCAGLTNLMLRAAGKRVPHAKGHGQGGTAAYAAYYEKVAREFDVHRKYPAGTLIGRKYRDVNSQGHVAVVLANGHVLQSIPDEGVNKTYTVKQSNGKGYYEYAVLPEDWLGEGAE
jgi:cell wall-associated NlpC family hydrolase